MNTSEIGKFLANLRKEANLTQEELAKKLNITHQAVSKWENGLSLPDLLLLDELSKLYKVSITEILYAKINEKNKVIETNLEDYYNKLRIKLYIKSILKIAAMVFSFLFVIFLLFFIANYNATSIYEINCDENGIVLYTSTITTYNDNTNISLEKVELDALDLGKDEYTIEIYYLKNNEPKVLFELNNTETTKRLDERINLNKIKDLYIKIIYIDSKGETKETTARLDKKLKYRSTLFFNKSKYQKEKYTPIEDNSDINIDRLKSMGYEENENNNYRKIVNDKKLGEIIYDVNDLQLTLIYHYKDYEIYLMQDKIVYRNPTPEKDRIYTIFIDDNYSCNSANCPDQKEIIKVSENQYKEYVKEYNKLFESNK